MAGDYTPPRSFGKDRYTFSGMSDLASTSVFRGSKTIRSSGPQPADSGNREAAVAVMSLPMMAKSPEVSSKMSGQLRAAHRGAPSACGPGPSLRKNIFNPFDVGRCWSSESQFLRFLHKGDENLNWQ
jgi:hypothetical protein